MPWMEICRLMPAEYMKALGKKPLTLKTFQAIADNYDPSYREAPLILGSHENTSSPAYGWARQIQLRGESLWAFVEFTADEVTDWIKKKLYTARSMFWFDDPAKGPYLGHIALLSGETPAIPGLAPIQLSAGSGERVATPLPEDKEIFLMGGDALSNLNKEVGAAMSGTQTQTVTPEQFNQLQADLKKEKEDREKAERELAAEKAKGRRESKKTELTTFFSGLEAEGKVTPAALQDGKLVDALLNLDEQNGGKTSLSFGGVACDPVDVIKSAFSALPKAVGTGEQATKKDAAGGDDGKGTSLALDLDDRVAVDKAVKAEQAKDTSLSYDAALQKVTAAAKAQATAAKK